MSNIIAVVLLIAASVVIASLWVCRNAMHAEIDLDFATNDDGDRLDQWWSETPLFTETVRDMDCDEVFSFAGQVEAWLRRSS